jgi:predicted TIM-barrel fold metal-dependent hydrolase
MMIIDSHAHVFQDWSGPCGLPSRQVHWKYIHKNVTRPAAKVYRLRDGAAADPQLLYRKGDNTWAGLREDVNFRVGPYGRLDFTVDDEDYYVQYMPVAMQRIESTPEFMITQMNAAEVDHCVLQAGFSYGYMNDYNALAQRQYPHRFSGLFHVDEPVADSEYWMGEARRAVEALGLKGIYYNLDGFARYGFRWWFDDARFDAFWEQLAGFDVPVFIEIASPPEYDQASYEAHLGRLARIRARHPQLRWVLVMAPQAGFYGRAGRWHFSEIAERIYTADNVWLELCFPISWGGIWEYPFVEAQALIRDLHGRIGAERLVWGSDMPNVERLCTYRQSLDYIRNHCNFLSEREKARILGENLGELLSLTAAVLSPPPPDPVIPA